MESSGNRDRAAKRRLSWLQDSGAGRAGAGGDAVAGPRRRRRRWVWRLVAGVAVTLLAAAATTAVAFPVAAAVTCPGCYGLERAGSGVYLERGASAAQKLQVVDLVAVAKQRVRAFYGETQSDPRILVCRTKRCYQRIGGGQEKGQALLDRALILSPAGVSEVIATHELAHVELHRRLGGKRDQAPRWFDEGLAVVVSNDLRYLAAPPAADRCLVGYAEAVTVTRQTEQPRSASVDDIYVKGACVVDRWVTAHGGSDAVLDLIRRMRSGERFSDIVRP